MSQPSHTERSASDPYTMELRLCDDAGMVSHERHPSESNPEGGATYLEILNFLKPVDRQYTGGPFACTGSAHLGGKHIRCTSPAHLAQSDIPALPGELLALLRDPDVVLPGELEVYEKVADWALGSLAVEGQAEEGSNA